MIDRRACLPVWDLEAAARLEGEEEGRIPACRRRKGKEKTVSGCRREMKKPGCSRVVQVPSWPGSLKSCPPDPEIRSGSLILLIRGQEVKKCEAFCQNKPTSDLAGLYWSTPGSWSPHEKEDEGFKGTKPISISPPGGS